MFVAHGNVFTNNFKQVEWYLKLQTTHWKGCTQEIKDQDILLWCFPTKISRLYKFFSRVHYFCPHLIKNHIEIVNTALTRCKQLNTRFFSFSKMRSVSFSTNKIVHASLKAESRSSSLWKDVTTFKESQSSCTAACGFCQDFCA